MGERRGGAVSEYITTQVSSKVRIRGKLKWGTQTQTKVDFGVQISTDDFGNENRAKNIIQTSKKRFMV